MLHLVNHHIQLFELLLLGLVVLRVLIVVLVWFLFDVAALAVVVRATDV